MAQDDLFPDDADEAAWLDGERSWESGGQMPPWPRGDRGREVMFWLGFMMARARDFFRRREMALYPDSVEPRP